MSVKLRAILRHVNPLRTLAVNLRLFPLGTALRFPVLCGYRCDIAGLRRGSVELIGPVRAGMVVIGISPTPRFSVKSLWTFVRFSKKGKLICGPGFVVRNGVSLIVGGVLRCGQDVLINQRAMVSCQKSVELGDHVRIGWDVQLLDSDCHLIYNETTNRIAIPYRPVKIGRNVWIASRVNIGKGAVIPDYSIVSRGALVTRNFGDVTTRGNVFSGIPAVLRATGFYRLLDVSLENRVSRTLKASEATSFDPKDMDVDVEAALNPPPHPGM